ncbi:hypothetical protein AVEN_51196-1 [Araneus ventricosus]|uniref:Uncharacterized protein n=1 Tax=Araneus ventricosus TaxID=182803 RepID=A0A4Y2H8U0_ARAVE|nr:hypothetical protein AVEN_51196-1 [Araneus ventricosus]
MECPLRMTFDGTRPNLQDEKAYVALAVNGQRPSRVLFVRYPYEVYTEFHEVPSTYWTPIHFVPTALILPDDMEKEWVEFFETHIGSVKKDNVDISIIQMALTMARHKICFRIKIDPKAKRKQRANRIQLMDKEIDLNMGVQEE